VAAGQTLDDRSAATAEAAPALAALVRSAVVTTPPAPAPAPVADRSLYAPRQKIYPQSVEAFFAA